MIEQMIEQISKWQLGVGRGRERGRGKGSGPSGRVAEAELGPKKILDRDRVGCASASRRMSSPRACIHLSLIDGSGLTHLSFAFRYLYKSSSSSPARRTSPCPSLPSMSLLLTTPPPLTISPTALSAMPAVSGPSSLSARSAQTSAPASPSTSAKRRRRDTDTDTDSSSPSTGTGPIRNTRRDKDVHVPKKKKAARACFHCQKAHLTCDDCTYSLPLTFDLSSPPLITWYASSSLSALYEAWHGRLVRRGPPETRQIPVRRRRAWSVTPFT
jgi:hypothetical protein